MRSSLYCCSAALADRGLALLSRRARWTNIWVWKDAPLAQCLKDLKEPKKTLIVSPSSSDWIVLCRVLLSFSLFYVVSYLTCPVFLLLYNVILCSTVFYHLESQSPPSRHVFSWVRVRLSWASSLTASWISLLLSFKLILQRFRYSSITSWSSQTLCCRKKFKDVYLSILEAIHLVLTSCSFLQLFLSPLTYSICRSMHTAGWNVLL